MCAVRGWSEVVGRTGVRDFRTVVRRGGAMVRDGCAGVRPGRTGVRGGVGKWRVGGRLFLRGQGFFRKVVNGAGLFGGDARMVGTGVREIRKGVRLLCAGVRNGVGDLPQRRGGRREGMRFRMRSASIILCALGAFAVIHFLPLCVVYIKPPGGGRFWRYPSGGAVWRGTRIRRGRIHLAGVL